MPNTSKRRRAPLQLKKSSVNVPVFDKEEMRRLREEGEELSRRAWKESEAMSVLDDRILRMRFR